MEKELVRDVSTDVGECLGVMFFVERQVDCSARWLAVLQIEALLQLDDAA